MITIEYNSGLKRRTTCVQNAAEGAPARAGWQRTSRPELPAESGVKGRTEPPDRRKQDRATTSRLRRPLLPLLAIGGGCWDRVRTRSSPGVGELLARCAALCSAFRFPPVCLCAPPFSASYYWSSISDGRCSQVKACPVSKSASQPVSMRQSAIR